uniref:Uncharacterized protein n=1 Tax=Caenorhabditis tropicalis TaxID=1561998 RepID=A0A1I7U7W6_9PELO
MKESLIVNISKATCVVALAARNMLSILKHDTSASRNGKRGNGGGGGELNVKPTFTSLSSRIDVLPRSSGMRIYI